MTFFTSQRNSRRYASKIQLLKALFSLSNHKIGLSVLAALSIPHLLQFTIKQCRDGRGSSSLFSTFLPLFLPFQHFSSLHQMSKRYHGSVVQHVFSKDFSINIYIQWGRSGHWSTVFLTSSNFA